MFLRKMFLPLNLLCLGAVFAQVPAMPLPAKYHVKLRYDIKSARDQHVRLYDAMIEHLKGLDFEFQPPLEEHPNTDREDRSKNYLQGLITPANAAKILTNPSIVSMLLVPEGFKLPDEQEDPVRVRIELASGFSMDRQRELADQVRPLLADVGFREATAYDHRGYNKRPFTRLVGTLPKGRLDMLLKDLRGQPAGWFAPRMMVEDLPTPLRNVSPILITEVLPDTAPIADAPFPPIRIQDDFEKISPDLWALVEAKEAQDKIVRVQVVFVGQPEEKTTRNLLIDKIPAIVVEGQLGQIATCLLRVGQVKDLAPLPQVSVLRLSQTVGVGVDPELKWPADNARALKLSGLDALHKKGFQGQGVRLAVIDSDFRGWERMVKDGKLPAKTRLIDLTAERIPDITPLPYPDNGDALGHGTQCALAAALAAPQVELTLVRIDAVDPYQYAEIIRYIRGGELSEHLDRRRDDLVKTRAELALRREGLLAERKKLMEDFTDETDLFRNFEFLGPVRGWIMSLREGNRQRLAYQDKLEEDFKARTRRFLRLFDEVKSLATIQVVANAQTWNQGYPLGGSSPLSRLLDTTAGKPLWFQSAGNTRGQAWSGLFRDDNGDGVMEFADQPAKASWTSELNFLGWQPHGKQATLDLPEGAKLRLTMQWREPHDPDYYLRPGEKDYYRKPLANLRLVLLRQQDPEAKALPADTMEAVARSGDWPQRQEHLPSSSVYEQELEFTVAKAGRYALRVERPLPTRWELKADAQGKHFHLDLRKGLQATGIRPAEAATLPALEKNWELQPRLFVEVVGEQRLQGRPTFASYTTDQGTVAMPGDARGVISVGAADFDGKTRPYSGTGPLPYAALSTRPTVLAYDALDVGQGGGAYGASLANAFAAGTYATLISSGQKREELLKSLQKKPGRVLKAGE